MKMIIRRFLVVVLVLTLVSSQLISIATAEENKFFYPKLTSELTYDPDSFDYDIKTLFAITLAADVANAGYLTSDELEQLTTDSYVFVGGDNEKVVVGIATESKMSFIICFFNKYNESSKQFCTGAYLEHCESGYNQGIYTLFVSNFLHSTVGECKKIESDDIVSMLSLINDTNNSNN